MCFDVELCRLGSMSPRVYVGHLIYKGKAALTVSPLDLQNLHNWMYVSLFLLLSFFYVLLLIDCSIIEFFFFLLSWILQSGAFKVSIISCFSLLLLLVCAHMIGTGSRWLLLLLCQFCVERPEFGVLVYKPNPKIKEVWLVDSFNSFVLSILIKNGLACM